MSRASKDKLTPNDSIAGYRLASRIAISQGCEVWQVQHGRGRQEYAMKITAPAMRGRRDQVAYLKHEYSVGKRFVCDSIIRMDDFGVENGLAFIVMEYFQAPNMKQWIREHAEESAELIRPAVCNSAAALGFVHQQGWIHRDVKPDNFLIGETGDVKLVDFALAKRQRGWFGRLFESSGKTQGTMSYMSPEQIRNNAQDCRSDIYSFGCVIYELVSGKPPFTGESPRDLLNKHLKSPVPAMKSQNGRLNPDFTNIVNRLLAKDPADRPASMDEILAPLKAIEIFQS